MNKSGYEIPDTVDPKKEADIKAKNQRILHSLYKDGLIDRIENVSRLTYEEFGRMKKQHHLNLGKVNELHSELKKFIYTEKTNVSTKFLSDYIGYFTYIKNWSVRYGHYPSSQKDAESIFEDILKLKVNFTVLDVNNQTLELPQPSGRYVAILKKETTIAFLVHKPNHHAQQSEFAEI